ncbi:unnamed protein product [Phaedon cochleariae]|uniref:Peptidase M10 metallopeptidase domain-containing protein n=1 Tax=Phaedon cochleariae TaxID=80249 RepID=A0A9N9X151_PHACE|nr:unnamed protein product [Phaedon cochleariae]
MHEIGHALGLSHSGVNTAIMYLWYQASPALFDIDDKMTIEYLYGQKTENYQPTTTSTTQTTESQKPISQHTSTTASSVPSNEPHNIDVTSTTSKPQITPTKLCEIQVPDFMFLATAPQFQNYRMYVGYNRFLWKIDLNDMRIPSQPELLDDYLPENLKDSRVSHVFQNSGSDLVTLINDSVYYAASFPNFRIHQNFNFPLPSGAKINAVYQTNSGQAYLLYNNDSYIAFDASQEFLQAKYQLFVISTRI